MRFRTWICIFLIVIFTLTGCSSANKSGDIVIGFAGPLTGDSALWGQSALKAAKIAVEECNSAGGINGRKIVLLEGDDKGDPKEAASVAQKYTANPNVVGILGHIFGSCEMVAGPIYQAAGIPNMVSTASAPDIPFIGNYVFRINVGDVVAAQQNADYIVENMGIKKMAVIYDNTDYGVAYKDALIERAKSLDCEISAVEVFVGSGQDRDFTVQLTKIKETNPEALFLSCYGPDAGLICDQARKLGFEGTFLGLDSTNSQHFIDLAKEAAEGTVISTYFDRNIDDPAAKEFVEKYESKYNEPTFPSAPYAYDAMNVLIDSLKRCETIDRKSLRDAIEQTKDLPGVTGLINFDENGDRPVAWNIIIEVKNGEFVLRDVVQ
ncbi:MAG: hypothetical protein E7234_02475 [Lachnospiraceae bacterium]|nr:hypothetical protein [Lachnospiraceae bacterium]